MASKLFAEHAPEASALALPPRYPHGSTLCSNATSIEGLLDRIPITNNMKKPLETDRRGKDKLVPPSCVAVQNWEKNLGNGGPPKE